MPTVRTKSAFTLVEMLLVIAIISIIAALGIMTYRNRFQTNRLDKVAVGMQHVLEAAMAYNVDNKEGHWPAPLACNAGTVDPELKSNFVDVYLPNGTVKSSFGSQYCWHEAGSADKLFWVAVKVPGDNATSQRLAKRLAGRLPNAVVTGDPESTESPATPCGSGACYVRAEITEPGQSSSQEMHLSIAAMGYCNPLNVTTNSMGSCQPDFSNGEPGEHFRITFRACPSNTIPMMNIAPNFIRLPGGKGAKQGVSFGYIGAQEDACTTTPESGRESCTGTVRVTVCAKDGQCSNPLSAPDSTTFGGSEGASYTVACVPPSQQREVSDG